jgi:hypothetical protein
MHLDKVRIAPSNFVHAPLVPKVREVRQLGKDERDVDLVVTGAHDEALQGLARFHLNQ